MKGSNVLNFDPGCKTMPHKDIARAIELALSLDIPYWPQLPNVSFYEDMYAQTSEGFPGVTIDIQGQKVLFNSARFDRDLATYSGKMAECGVPGGQHRGTPG